ncbi:hypothetical protein ACGF7W_34670 [Streptomyces sp. NPDC048219]|uniref:hypothetical protein n=1 Tax=Streptomyces sp. NPDC048219 TaxID=3365517 RepID=UPI00371D7168
MTFAYKDPDGFGLLITRTTDQRGREVLDLSVSNPADGQGWQSGSNVQIPEEKLLAGVQETATASTDPRQPLRLVIERPEPGDWHGRLDVLEALEDAGWTADPEYPLSILRHPSGAVWAVTNESGDSGLTCPNGANTAFPSDTPSIVVIAACLAATHTTVPSEAR